jgi:hypothetical protein
MAAPVKNLVDATGLSIRCPQQIKTNVPKRSPYILKVGQAFPVNSFSNANRWLIVTPKFARVKLLLNAKTQSTISQKQAHQVSIATFPASYKERTGGNGARPAVGQLWPRGVC